MSRCHADERHLGAGDDLFLRAEMLRLRLSITPSSRHDFGIEEE